MVRKKWRDIERGYGGGKKRGEKGEEEEERKGGEKKGTHPGGTRGDCLADE